MTDFIIQQVYFISEALNWKESLSQFEYVDFYHSFDYVYLESLRINGTPKLIIISMPSGLIGLVMIFRKIPGETQYFDATSVYGYNGVLTSPHLTSSDFNLGIAKIKKVLAERGCVSFFNRESVFTAHRLPDAKEVGKTIAVDLKQKISEYENSLAEGHRQEIKYLRRDGLKVIEAQTDEQIKDFHEIYAETMVRRGANTQYFFSLKYFQAILKNIQAAPVLKMVYHENKPIAGSIFTMQGANIHYLFSGSVPQVTSYPATKLILDQVIRDNIEGKKHQLLHLGGGLAGQSDGLFKFKAGFGKIILPFYTTQWILIPEVYERLSAHTSPQSSFFPRYRGI